MNSMLLRFVLVQVIFSQILTPYVIKMGIDPSGHALAQSSSAIYKSFVFSSLSSLNVSSNPYRMIAAVTALSDCLWTHRTASSHHSVMDMVLATILMGISFGGVYAAQRTFATYAPKAARLLIAKIPKKVLNCQVFLLFS